MCVEFDFVGLDFDRVQVTILIHVVALPVIGTSLYFECFGDYLCITVWHTVQLFCLFERGYFVIVDTNSYSHLWNLYLLLKVCCHLYHCVEIVSSVHTSLSNNKVSFFSRD